MRACVRRTDRHSKTYSPVPKQTDKQTDRQILMKGRKPNHHRNIRNKQKEEKREEISYETVVSSIRVSEVLTVLNN